MRIDIWSDIACPWCYIGLNRFRAALDGFPHSNEVAVALHSFQLDPTLPERYDGTEADYLVVSKGISRDQVGQMLAQVSEVAAADGLELNFAAVRPANSWRAHRLLHVSGQADPSGNLEWDLEQRLFRAHFVDGEVISDPDVLARIASEVGLDDEPARRAIGNAQATNVYGEGDELDAAVRADLARAAQLGIRGVPFFVVNEKYGVSGAQPVELFDDALTKAWQESHPAPALRPLSGLGVDVGTPGPACGPDGCD